MRSAGGVSAGRGEPRCGCRPGARRQAFTWRLIRQASRRLSWGIADQAVSSITNFAVNIYVARALGAAEFGAFSLAYVTYGFLLNASRGLATDPLLVRFSGTDPATWRRAVANCTGTATVVGLLACLCALAAAAALHGTARAAFLALGLTLPGLLLQDSWRFAFFALGRGSQAFLNDLVWAAAHGSRPMLAAAGPVTRTCSGSSSRGAPSATVGAAIGPLQARVLPRLSGACEWLSQHRDLGPRYLAEGTANSASTQLRNYGVGLMLGLAAVGYVQASTTLIGPFMVIFFGMGAGHLAGGRPGSAPLPPVPAAVLPADQRRACPARRSPGELFCWWRCPEDSGNWLLPQLWRPTYPLILPLTISVDGRLRAGRRGHGPARPGGRPAEPARHGRDVGHFRRLCPGRERGRRSRRDDLRCRGGGHGSARCVFWWELRSALGQASNMLASLRYVGNTPLNPVKPSPPAGRHREAPGETARSRQRVPLTAQAAHPETPGSGSVALINMSQPGTDWHTRL